jgi:hypothetical protein
MSLVRRSKAPCRKAGNSETPELQRTPKDGPGAGREGKGQGGYRWFRLEHSALSLRELRHASRRALVSGRSRSTLGNPAHEWTQGTSQLERTSSSSEGSKTSVMERMPTWR